MTWGPGSAEVDTLLEGGELKPRPAAPRSAAYDRQPLDRCGNRHQDRVCMAGSLDRETHSRHVRTPHGN